MLDYVSKELNRICTNAGVQCTVTMDPRDYKKVFQFKNLSRHTVEISHDKWYLFIGPDETVEIKTLNNEDPKITQWFVWYKRVT